MSLRNLSSPMNQSGGRIARALPVGGRVPFSGPVRGRPQPPISIGSPGGGIAIGRPVAPPTNIGRPLPPVSIGGPSGMPTIPPVMQGPMPVQGRPVPVPSGIPATRPPANVLPGAPPQNISTPQPITVGPVTPPGSITPIGGREREAGILPVPEGLPTPKYTTGLPADDIVSALPVGPSIPFTPPTDTVVGRPVESPISIGGPGGGPTYSNRPAMAPTIFDQVVAGVTPGFDVTGGNPLAGAPGFSNTGVGTSQPADDTTGMATTTGATDSTGMTTTTAAPPAPTQAPASTEAGAGTAQATTTTTTAPPQVAGGTPFASGVTQVATGLDPLTEQLLFGIGGQGGFIPGAMRAVEKTFYDDQGNPVVIDEQVAGFSPDQLQAMQMQREALGIQDPYLQGAGQAFGAGTQALEEGLQRGRTAAIGALEATKGGVGSLQQGLGESADILRGTLGGYDPSMTSQFYDPFEDRVVQQTIEDIMEQGAKSDIGARASDIARGGESAFGSRARLGAGERQEALGRGLAEALSGIRSRGFREAQQTGLGEFARQKAAERAASTGLASLAGQGFGGSQALAGALSGLGQTEQDIGQQRFSGQFGLGTSLQGLGAQAAGASASDIAALYGMGSQQQGQAQAMLDAQRRNLQQRQMTPLLQYQALAPFISMAPAGQFTTTTLFAPRPSPMQIGIGTGLQAFGALGNLYGGN